MAKWINQYSNLQQEEIRERYTMYCEGYKIEFP